MVGVMIIITVVFIYAQVQLRGILLVITLRGYAQYFAQKDCMLIAILEQDNVSLFAQELMIFMEMLQDLTIALVIVRQIDVKLIA